MKNYTSDRPRVHASCTIEQINAALTEYKKFIKAKPSDNLTPLLRECIEDLEEELSLRAWHDMKPYRFSFTSNGQRHQWVRFYRISMEEALTDCKQVARREFPDAHGFMIESDQNSAEIRQSWGLPR